ncbi:MAG: hypothetical protein ABH867_04390 [Patescibacteria group bacterium]|nr:hypothetical protein [Patescibacteria group bacterium]
MTKVKKDSAVAKVTYKSPKSDIWRAYKELIENIEKQGAEKVSEKINEQTLTLTKGWLERVNNLHTTLQKEIETIESEFKKASLVLADLAESKKSVEKLMKDEEEEAKKAQKREKEEYDYEFEKLKKRQEEELSEYSKKVLAELEERKAKLGEQEAELTDLRNQAKTFEARLEKTAKEAADAETIELTKEFEHEKELAKQKAQSIQELLSQKVESLTKTISELKNENQRLSQLLSQTNSNLTKIAERAVEKGSNFQISSAKNQE